MISKKGSGTLWGTVASILIVMALFYGLFDYTSSNYESANISAQVGYNDSTESTIQAAQATLETDIDTIEATARNITEADGNFIQVAWNGLTGLAATLRLFFDIGAVGITVFEALVPGLAFLPGWVKILIEMAIIIWIVLIILGAFKGEAKT